MKWTPAVPIEKVHESVMPKATDVTDIVRRATVAWLQSGGTGPPTNTSGFKLYKGLGYAVLHGAGGVLAVYRVRPDSLMLRRMKRWPKGVEK